MKKIIIVFLLLMSVSVFAQENNCRYETKTETINGEIKSTQEVKYCVENITLEEKSFWSEFIKTPQFETTLILTLAFIMEHLL
jgi:hypothetical protein